MKFETSTDQLCTAVLLAVRFTERRPNLPVLSTILVTAQGDKLTLRATNLECGVEVVVPAKILSEGTVAVPASVLQGFLTNAKTKTVSGELVGDLCKIKTDRASANIKTIPNDDFPILPQVSAEKSFTAKSSDLSKAIRSVAYCASTSSVKPELQSVLLYGEPGKLIAVATDSFRLAEKVVPLRGTAPGAQLLIPARNAAELMKILDTVQTEVELYYNENQLSVQVEGIYYTTRLIDGAFPNYRQILPKTFTTETVVLREDMGSSLKSLSIFADKFAQVVLGVDVAKKTLELTSRNPDVGEQTSTMVATVSGESVSVSFNGKYLADSLQGISGESVRLYLNGPGKPMLIKDAGDESFLYLAMPMNR